MTPLTSQVLQTLRARAAVDVRDTSVGARACIIASLWRAIGGQIIVWTPTPDVADRVCNDAAYYLEDAGDALSVLRPRGQAGSPVSPTERGERIEVLAALAAGRAGIYCVPHAALRQPLPSPARWRDDTLTLRVGDEMAWESLLERLVTLGYERADMVSAAGEFAVRGGIVDCFPATADAPIRMEFFGDRLESARSFALADQRSIDAVSRIDVAPWDEQALSSDGAFIGEYAGGAVFVVEDPELTCAIDLGFDVERDDRSVAAAGGADEDEDGDESSDLASLDRNTTSVEFSQAFTLESIDARLAPRAIFNFASTGVRVTREADLAVAMPAEPAPAYNRSMDRFVEDARRRTAAGELVAVITVGHRRIREVLAEHDIPVLPAPERWQRGDGGRILVAEGAIDEGFAMPAIGVTVIGDAEMFGHAARRQKLKAAKEGVPITEADLRPGEFFVHAHHGIGQYLGLEHIEVEGVGRDFLALKYAGNDRLYVPVEMMHLVRRYQASEGAAPKLSKMGGSDWQRTRSKVRDAVDKIAEGLVRLYAEREAALGHAFAPDTPWQAELEESFPYDETPDQRAAVVAVKEDMQRARPIDRLIAGDVGYGKTEVAIRAAFKAIMDQRQVAVLVPTTVLGAQHYRTFAERFAAFPVRVAMLSRLRAPADQKETLRGLLDGSVDIVIGTHRLLQRDVGFKQLGLVIVDEEQRFGVSHKERLKELRLSVDVLTLSATPIPRTLHMSMVGVRDMSRIQTPPVDRLAVKTVVAPTSDALIASAIGQELDRGGQVFFVHNRIETIYGVRDALAKLVPRARIRVGHGQMEARELENVMIAFVEGAFDVLVSTTIVENGLDIRNANTIVINNADRFGLAQLYQLRGRVGRGAHQAYAYMLYQPHRALSEQAQARLDAIREFAHLGSGLRLAMRDLEIRGAGNLLGHAQSGFIAQVGFDTYCQILQEAIGERTGAKAPGLQESAPQVVLDIRVSAYIPSAYVRGASQKFALYQRLAAARGVDEVDAVGQELRDRFGPLPKEVEALLDLAKLRVLSAAKGVQKLALEQRRLTLEVGRHFSLSEGALPALTSLTRGNFRFTKGAIVADLPAHGQTGDGLLAAVREIVAAL
jgi:transcription-repair coupling factor (superfamily II helicase)